MALLFLFALKFKLYLLLKLDIIVLCTFCANFSPECVSVELRSGETVARVAVKIDF